MQLFRDKPEESDPLNDIISSFLRFAYRDGASAILLELESDEFQVFYFIRGEKELNSKLPLYVYAPLVNRVREIAGLKIPNSDAVIAEEGLVQVRMRDSEHGLHMNYDLRVNIAPTATGSKILITIESTD